MLPARGATEDPRWAFPSSLMWLRVRPLSASSSTAASRFMLRIMDASLGAT